MKYGDRLDWAAAKAISPFEYISSFIKYGISEGNVSKVNIK